jgi:hypothetical protein
MNQETFRPDYSQLKCGRFTKLDFSKPPPHDVQADKKAFLCQTPNGVHFELPAKRAPKSPAPQGSQ